MTTTVKKSKSKRIAHWFVVSLSAGLLSFLTCLALLAMDDLLLSKLASASTNVASPVERAFGLREGKPDQEALESGACYRALVSSSGDSVLTVREFANGAIVIPKAGTRTTGLCVDVHGAHRVSFSGAMLDAVSRYGLGQFAGTIQESSDTTKVVFERGTMSVFTGAITPARVASSAPCVAGLLQSVTVRDVSIDRRFRGASHHEEVTIDGGVVWAIYRHAWHNTNPIERAAESDLLGAFSGTITTFDDAQASMTKYVFAKGDVSHVLSPTNEVVRLGVRGALPNASCERDPSLRGEYRCSGL